MRIFYGDRDVVVNDKNNYAEHAGHVMYVGHMDYCARRVLCSS